MRGPHAAGPLRPASFEAARARRAPGPEVGLSAAIPSRSRRDLGPRADASCERPRRGRPRPPALACAARGARTASRNSSAATRAAGDPAPSRSHGQLVSVLPGADDRASKEPSAAVEARRVSNFPRAQRLAIRPVGIPREAGDGRRCARHGLGERRRSGEPARGSPRARASEADVIGRDGRRSDLRADRARAAPRSP